MDSIKTYTLRNIEVQANGIIRNEKGRLIARLVGDIDFEGEHIADISRERELRSTIWHRSKMQLSKSGEYSFYHEDTDETVSLSREQLIHEVGIDEVEKLEQEAKDYFN